MYRDERVTTYLDDLAAKRPAPGGGSASALTGAVGAALSLMAANYTIGKEAYRAHEDEVKEIAVALERERARFTELIDKDVEAYTKLSAAFRLKKGACVDGELKEATAVPLAIAEAALVSLRCSARLADRCNRNLVSDVGVAGAMLVAAFEGAGYNVAINLAAMKDAAYAEGVRVNLRASRDEAAGLGEEITAKVRSIMGWKA